VGGFIDSIGTVDEGSGATSEVADDINGSTVSGGRASMLFTPSETFSLQLTAYIQDIDQPMLRAASIRTTRPATRFMAA
jgi:hypothetical protein